jgi:alpha-L-fucosidase
MNKPLLAGLVGIVSAFAGLPVSATTHLEPLAPAPSPAADAASDADHEARMGWWRDARFGMFIHWGLYAIPAGEWPGKGNRHGEWIRDTAQIPLEEYDKLKAKFNPTKFDADAWVALAQEAGMRYLVITSKHHDGFALFDSAQTDWDVMSTPFKRDIMKELSDACQKTKAGTASGGPTYPVRFCMYHSIMDWHHPDYLPRRPWEKAARGTDGADFDRFVTYLKAQLAEICSPKYDPGLIWFDGEWEGTWTHERGKDLHAYMRKIAPNVVVNNRIDKGRAGMEGSTEAGFLGDYATPEQTIPETGLPGDWETCMTMNGNWGYNAADKNFKNTTDLVQKLCDIASKGGNFLLNVGPTAEGEIPPESVKMLKEIGAWMRVNGEAIYGTQRSPLSEMPKWGRVTLKSVKGDNGNPITRLYLHVFEMPADGKLVLPGLLNEPVKAWALHAPARDAKLVAKQLGGSIEVDVSAAMDAVKSAPAPVTVFAIEVGGAPDASIAPTINAFADQFVTSTDVTIDCPMKGVEIRYTGDGTEPTAESRKYEGSFAITKAMVIKARAFRGGKAVTPVVARAFVNAPPRASVVLDKTEPGLSVACYTGEFKKLPDFATLKPAKEGIAKEISIKEACADDNYALRFTGYVYVPKTDVYTFHLASDDGSRLLIGSGVTVDNDGLHSLAEKSATVVLAGGWHPITVEMFEATGGAGLGLVISSPGSLRKAILPEHLARAGK